MFESSTMRARRLEPASAPTAPIRAPFPTAPRPLNPVTPRAPRPVLPDRLAERARPLALADERRLPLAPALVPLLGADGLRRGTTVVVTGASGASDDPVRPRADPAPGASAMALALAAGPSAAGSWVAAVGLPDLGMVAAHEAGVVLDRLALVPHPPKASWAATVAALIDGIDVVLVRAAGVRPADARRLTARVRERGAVLVPLGDGWPEPPELRLTVTGGTWHGLGDGHGHLRARLAQIQVTGRGGASRPRTGQLWLPGPGGVASTPAGPGALPPAWPLASSRAAAGLASAGLGDDAELAGAIGPSHTGTGHRAVLGPDGQAEAG
jgi:hypothetical protein